MGCRGNIQIQFSNKRSIYFYTHWRGNSIREVVQSANDDVSIESISYAVPKDRQETKS